MNVRHRWVAAMVVAVVGCSGPATDRQSVLSPLPDGANKGSTTALAVGDAGEPLGTLATYVAAVDVAAQNGLEVWIDTDLVTRWEQGPASIAAGVGRVAELAHHRGVVGVKIAEELGEDDGLGSGRQVLAFLRDVSRELRRALPPKTLILVDIVVPELGCSPGDPAVASASHACAVTARERWPGATLEVVDKVVASGEVDAVNVSTGLLDHAKYESWGTSREQAQRMAWAEIDRRGWRDHVQVRARKAMAVPLPFASAQDAAAAVPTFVDIPAASGAVGVDIWTWRQGYRGRTVGLLPSGSRSNALWRALEGRRARGVAMLTHFTPSQVRESVRADLAEIATVFSGVFVAAGTG